ncbi:MAG: glycosyltransferase family 2 protein [Actinobacteria bacterium]|nr:glycosyltransferase family 2 protein [Actinomycetota bacterium]
MSLVSAVIVAYGAEPWLERSVRAALQSDGVDVEVVLVDNGCTDGAVDAVAPLPGVTAVRPGCNLGFAGGCQAGVAASRGDVVAFVNPDAVVAPDALARLAAVAAEPGVAIATAGVRLADRPESMNSAGNDVHFLGMSWSGGFGEPATEHAVRRQVLAASGAGMAMRREVWDTVGGMEVEMFAYYEDADLSLRCWQQGLSVAYVPDAVVVHRYEFSRNPRKLYLVERNRLCMVLTLYEARTLWLLGPALLGLELAVVALALSQGWSRQKLAGWAWLVRRRRWLRERRRVVQTARRVSDRELGERFATSLSPGNLVLPTWLGPLDRLLARYWELVRRHL